MCKMVHKSLIKILLKAHKYLLEKIIIITREVVVVLQKKENNNNNNNHLKNLN